MFLHKRLARLARCQSRLSRTVVKLGQLAHFVFVTLFRSSELHSLPFRISWLNFRNLQESCIVSLPWWFTNVNWVLCLACLVWAGRFQPRSYLCTFSRAPPWDCAAWDAAVNLHLQWISCTTAFGPFWATEGDSWPAWTSRAPRAAQPARQEDRLNSWRVPHHSECCYRCIHLQQRQWQRIHNNLCSCLRRCPWRPEGNVFCFRLQGLLRFLEIRISLGDDQNSCSYVCIVSFLWGHAVGMGVFSEFMPIGMGSFPELVPFGMD